MTVHELAEVPARRAAAKVEQALVDLGLATRGEIARHAQMVDDEITLGLVRLDAAGKLQWCGPAFGWGLQP